MLRERQAFIFDEKIFKQSELSTIKKAKNIDFESISAINTSSINCHIASISSNIELLSLTETFMSFYVEHRKTRELQKQLNYKKRALDAMVNEAASRVEIEIEEYRKRKMYEIEHNRKMLEATLEKLRKEADFTNKKNIEEYRKKKKQKDVLDISRKNLENNLKLVSDIIREAEENKMNNNKYYHQMNEKYRIEIRAYSKIIKNFV